MILVTATGRLGRDPELKDTSNGKQMCVINVGCDVYNHKEKEKQTTWFRVVIFGKDAAYLARASKGDAVTFSGETLFTVWDSNNGAKVDANCTADHVALHAKPGDAKPARDYNQSNDGGGFNSDDIQF